ncbi:TetR/AcrR family transcriptional regulator [Anaeromicrobium sediminis]|uniref:TetR/AcrR family transcriptional regulator n=1 Tax=Anaeromicrobium sediminis TaxID=1478221 RepID=UPI001595C571|nr:TetR/AcrR family transcriptional regulator [Anaeromicrobium sediminis]
MNRKEITRYNILKAGLDLFSEKGYNSVTTKEIAKAAGVNEVTVFRRFGNKKNILENILEELVFKVAVEEVFHKTVSYDLERDLTYIAKKYNEYLDRNKKIIMIIFKEFHMKENYELTKFPKKLKELLVEYFKKMQEMGKVKEENPELLAANFLIYCFGMFMSNLLTNGNITKLSKGECIDHMIPIYVKGYEV